MHKIMLVDDHEIVRDGIARMLNRERTYDVTASVGTISEMLALLKRQQPELILLDLKVQDGDGVSAAVQIKRRYPKIKIIILSGYIEPDMAQEAKRIGVEGYLLKTIASDHLISMINHVLSGERAYDAEVEILPEDEIIEPLINLSKQERRLMHLLCLGKTSKEIAGAMGLKEKTVRNYTSNIYQKIHVSSRSEAVSYYLRNRVLSQNRGK